jgi:hypothetical protein
MSSTSLVLNLGSGKDFRDDCINADIQLRVKHDWLLDICNVPWGDAISTRLGDFDIQPDPTHLRAFNEKSWLYYTDWHWYLGWEDRFYVTHLEFRLNPIAQDLKLTQEELLRTPRAVDSMYVVLQKGKK